MKRFRRPLFNGLAAALLVGAVLPSWICVRSSCERRAASLACVRLCAHSRALLTDGGRLASLGADVCAVAASFAAPTLAASEVHLNPPEQSALVSVFPGALPALPLLTAASAARAPPRPSSYLSSDHPFANAPPTLL
jgi:hypothetical protein